MTTDEIESAYERSQPLDFARHPLEACELPLREMFYPLGFPTELRTNSPEILTQTRLLWSVYEKGFDTDPIRVEVRVVEDDSGGLPHAPVFHMMQPLLINIASPNNFSIANLDRCITQITRTRATLNDRTYMKWFFLGNSPVCHIVTRYATPVHAGCVARNGRGMLLCGDSGSGKSTLSFACALAGWTYVTDDASYVLNNRTDREVTGNCHQLRFRPSAVDIFPELEGLEIAPYAAGKPSIEMPTASLPHIVCAPTTQVDFLVFLSRRVSGPQEVVPFRKEVARQSMREVFFGSRESLAMQYATLERLLTAEVVELRYSDLDWAVHRLDSLAREGC